MRTNHAILRVGLRNNTVEEIAKGLFEVLTVTQLEQLMTVVDGLVDEGMDEALELDEG